MDALKTEHRTLNAELPTSKDVMRHSLPRKSPSELAEELLLRFPGVDRGELLKAMVGHYFFAMRHGNKREERAACDFLNEVQARALEQFERAKRKFDVQRSELEVQSSNPKP